MLRGKFLLAVINTDAAIIHPSRRELASEVDKQCVSNITAIFFTLMSSCRVPGTSLTHPRYEKF
jgi:hypothetical protein